MGLDRLAMMLPSVDEDSAGLDVSLSRGGAARAGGWSCGRPAKCA